MEIDVEVQNTGGYYSGREVVQVYVTLPGAGRKKECRRLAGFAKTPLLQPGEACRLTVSVEQKQLAVFSEQESAWVIDKGAYGIWIGEHSASLRHVATLNVMEHTVIEHTNRICPLQETLQEPAGSHWEKDVQEASSGEAEGQEIAEYVFVPGKEEHKDCMRYPAADWPAEDLIPLLYGNITQNTSMLGSAGCHVPGSAGETAETLEEKYGIRSLVMADGPAGLRLRQSYEADRESGIVYGAGVLGCLENGFLEPMEHHEGAEIYYQFCTAFPVGTLMAQTWDEELLKEFGRAIAVEMKEFYVDLWLAPGMNIQRNPLCGRNFEYYSEDPFLAGKLAAAMVRGIQSNGVGTSIKHFAGNNQESNRMANNSIVSERALREIYLKGFEIAVKESDPWTVMSSYNYINGQYASESKDLLTDILRSDWGYRGTVMTDWFGGSDGAAQVTAGNDMLQPGLDKQYNSIIAAVKDGSLDEKLIDRNVKRILNLIVRTPHFKGYKYSNKPDLAAHAAVTRQSATEGMVLLKNDNNTLPLKPSCKKVALLGCTSYDFIAGGTGSGNVNRAYTVSLLEGLQNAGYQLDAKLGSDYKAHIETERAKAENSDNPLAKFLPTPRPGEMTIDRARMDDLAAANDVALITIGRNSGEFLDRTPADFDLSTAEKLLIESATQAFHSAGKQVVVVLNIGGVIETASWKDKPDAILCAWQAGQEGGNSVTDILAGRVSPSGHLTMTFPRSFVDHASSHNFPLEGAMSSFNFADHGQSTGKHLWDYTPYEEDIYVGYRYFDSLRQRRVLSLRSRPQLHHLRHSQPRRSP